MAYSVLSQWWETAKMNHHNGHDTSADSNMLFFACGALAGAAVALMFAPARGRETRDMLAQRSRQVADMGREMLGEHGERLSTAIERGRETATHLGERLGQAVEQGKSGYREAVRHGQRVAGDALQSAEEAARTLRADAKGATESV